MSRRPSNPLHAQLDIPATDDAATIAVAAAHRPLLMRSLQLENFMLHENSRLEFDRPITLLTGANGSGKTQILDALLLTLGAKSQRVRKQGLGDLVGPAGDSARVTLTLNNPLVKSGTQHLRPLWTGLVDIDKLTDYDTVNVIAEMKRDDESLTYRLGPEGAERRVTQSNVEKLFQQAGVSPDNALAFTEEGTISSFSSDSPQKQFEAFLETTSLLDLRRTLLNTLNEVGICQTRLDPLEQQYHLQRTLLDHMRTDLENLARREELEKRVERLKAEIAWSAFRDLEIQADNLKQLKDATAARLKKSREALTTNGQDQDKNRRHLEKWRDESSRLEIALRNRAVALGEKRASLRHADDDEIRITTAIDKKTAELEILTQEIDSAANAISQSELRAAKSKFEQLTHALNEVAKQITDLESQARQGLRDINASLGGGIGSQGMEFIQQALNLRESLATSELGALKDPARRWFGPLALEWSLPTNTPKDLADAARIALPVLLADSLGDFVVTDEAALAVLTKLVAAKYTSSAPPPFRVWVASALQAPGKPPEILTPEIKTHWYWLSDWIEAPDPVRKYFAAHAPLAILLEPAPLPTLRQWAAQTRHRIYVVPLGMVVSEHFLFWPDEVNLQAQAQFVADTNERGARIRLLAQARMLKPQRDKLQQERDAASAEYDRLDLAHQKHQTDAKTRQKLATERDELDTQRTLIRQRAMKLEKEIKKLEAESQDQQAKAAVDEKLEMALKRQTELEAKERELVGEIATLELKRQNLEQELKSKLDAAREKKVAASALGPAPDQYRELATIEAELNQTLGVLDGLKRVTRTKSEYEMQKARVEELHSQMKNAKDHLAHLQKDLETRLGEWSHDLRDRLSGAASVLRHLLRTHFADVVLGAVDGIRRGKTKEGAAGLDLRVKRYNGRLLGLSGLSGGEKVLVVGGLIFALHCLTDSPVHALDEFTQKLDVEFKAAAFRMAVEAVNYAASRSQSIYTPQFVLLCPDTLGVAIDSNQVAQVVVLRTDVPLHNTNNGNNLDGTTTRPVAITRRPATI